jgi:hypothetical protein
MDSLRLGSKMTLAWGSKALSERRTVLPCYQTYGFTWLSPCLTISNFRSVLVIRYATLVRLHVCCSPQPVACDRAYIGAPLATLSVFRCTLQGSIMAKTKYAALTTSSRHIPPLSLHCFGRRPECR